MSEILITKPGVLTEDDKKALRNAGIVPVEAENPDEVRFMRSTVEIGGHEMALAAMSALRRANSSTGNELFVKLVTEAIERKSTAELAKEQGDG